EQRSVFRRLTLAGSSLAECAALFRPTALCPTVLTVTGTNPSICSLGSGGPMPLQLAWRILVDQKGRTLLATGGIFIAILLIFVELGFFVAVPQGGMLVYAHLRFDPPV